MHYLLVENTISGPANLSAPEAVTNQQFSQQLAAHYHRPAILPMPAAALRLAMGEASNLLLNSQKVIPKRLLEAGFEFSFPTLDSALSDLC